MPERLVALARPLAILATAALVAVFMVTSRPVLETRSVEAPLPRVGVQTVALGAVPVTVVAHGTVAAWRELALTAEVTGRVTWKSPRFEPGVVVDAGEPLLRLDATDYELALAEARQALASAELALADARALRQAARVEEAEATVAAARARIARAERDLANTEVVAPYAAVVDAQQVEPGQYVTAGTQLGGILGAERAEVRLPVPPQDIAFIEGAVGSTVTLHDEAGVERRWEGTLARIEARIDTQTRVYPVVVEIAAPLDARRHGQPLPFGLFVRAEITGEHVPGAVVIPQAALHGDSDVFLFEDGRLRRRSVQVARTSARGALVTGGLADGDRVVTTRLDLMFDSMEVSLLDE